MKSVQRRVVRAVGGVCAIMAAGIHAPGLLAQEKSSPLALEEIIVTAQKREQASMDVPVAIGTFSAADMANTGALTLQEIGDYIPGFDAGGELTNAVREKPFSVVLFDEIEKAHPRILDKFLQILEDGRLTDGRGDTAYFSETILVFTSNLGIFVEDAQGQRVQTVQPGDPYEKVESRVREAIGEHFTFKLSRPELLNRIGDNIVVFDFISKSVAEQIFTGMLRNVARRLYDELKLKLSIPAPVLAELLQRCTHDLSHGGRGIGNRLESAFINPLSRALFEQDTEGKQQIVVSAISETNKVVTLELQVS